MNKFSFNTEYIANYALKYNLSEDEVAPQTYGMYWCMLATGIHRIFTKEHLHEFLFRLAITMNSIGLVENWFGWDKFLTFSIGEDYYALTEQDVFNHVGFESTDAYTDMISRDNYYNRVYGLIGTAQLTGQITGDFHVIKPGKLLTEEEDVYQIKFPKETLHVTPELERKAAFFEDDLLKDMDSKLFKLSTAAEDKLKELEERKQKIKNLPVFNLDAIPKEIQKKCLFLMFNKKYASYLINQVSKEEYYKETYKYFHLAWLVANKLLWFENGFDFNHVEGLDLDPMDYSDDGISFNIQEFFEDYNLAECEELLKGVGLK